MRFKNISPIKALFKNEINNEHTPGPLYINPSFTDWDKVYPGVEFSWTILASAE